ncbi:MAG: hypothetical protein J2P19_08605, partial [Pseudonocardia sp.]|nr:hypothetical protein [Pseudonocardia sp.]
VQVIEFCWGIMRARVITAVVLAVGTLVVSASLDHSSEPEVSRAVRNVDLDGVWHLARIRG